MFAGVRRADDGVRLKAATTGLLEPVELDVTDEAGVERAVKEIGERLDGTLTAVVNNAGIGVGGPIEYIALDDWRRQFEVNVIGQIAVTKACLPLIRAASNGRIVFIGSIGGRVSTPLMGPYSASKFALEAITESLRHELRPAGIKVALVEPGAIKTPMWAKANDTADDIEAQLPPEGRRRYGKAIAGIRTGFATQDRNAIPAQRVAEVIEKALSSSRPRARYLVGRDAHVAATIARFLPDSARDRLVRAASRA